MKEYIRLSSLAIEAMKNKEYEKAASYWQSAKIKVVHPSSHYERAYRMYLHCMALFRRNDPVYQVKRLDTAFTSLMNQHVRHHEA